MTRSAAGVDYNPFQFFQRLVLTRPREVYYIGGSDVLPAPLEPKREAYVISKLDTDQHQEAKAILIEHNLRLVVYIAKKFDNTGVGVEDLISIGTIGLIKAVNTYRSSRKVKLATYAARCIENEILMSIRASRKFTSEVSLNVPIGTDKDGNEINLNDILGTDPNEIVDSIHEKIRIQHMLLAIHNTLTPREQKVLIHRYGLFRTHPKTQRETAALLGISRSYVSRIEKKALEKLYEELHSDTI